MKIFTLNGVGEYRNNSMGSNIDDNFDRATLELQYKPKLFKQFLTEIVFLILINKYPNIRNSRTRTYISYKQLRSDGTNIHREERIQQMMITEEGIGYLIQTIKSIFKTS